MSPFPTAAQLAQSQLAVAAAEVQAHAQVHAQVSLAHLMQWMELNHQPKEASVQPLLPPGMTLRLTAAGLSPLMAKHSSVAVDKPVISRGQRWQQPLGSQTWHPCLSVPQQQAGGSSRAGSGGGSGAAPPAPPPRAKAKAEPGGRQGPQEQRKCRDTLRTYLEELRNVDPRCVFITRRINKLGFRSKSLLERHYAQYGEVSQVLVAHSKVKPFPNTGTLPRTRPGNFGLVVMKSPEVVQRILAEGPEQTVMGVEIQAFQFEQLKVDKDLDDDELEAAPTERPATRATKGGRAQLDEGTESLASGSTGSAAEVGVKDTSSTSSMSDWLRLRSSLTLCSNSNASNEKASGSDQSSQGSQGSHGSQGSRHHLPHGVPAPEPVAAKGTTPAADMQQSASLNVQSLEHLTSRTSAAGGDCATSAGEMQMLFAAVLNELSGIANDSEQMSSFTREQSMNAAALAQWAQQSLKRLEEECQQKIMELLQVQSTTPPLVPQVSPVAFAPPSCGPVPQGPGLSPAPVQHVPPAPGLVPYEGASLAAAATQVGQPHLPYSWLGAATSVLPPGTAGPVATQLGAGLACGPLAGAAVPSPLAAVPGAEAAAAAAATAGGTATATATAPPAPPGGGGTAACCAEAGGGAGAGEAVSAGRVAGRQSTLRWGHSRLPEECVPGQRDTLRSHLTELSTEDPECIFITRRINKLGFRSREVLHQHFSQYGDVSRVLVAHSKVKPFRDSSGQLRTRPGGLGLIVMRKAASVRSILSLGEEQMVAGHQIRVQCFEKPKVDDTSYNGCGTSTSTGSTGSKSQRIRSDGSGTQSPDKSEEGGSSEPTEKCDADVGSSGPESPESTS